MKNYYKVKEVSKMLDLSLRVTKLKVQEGEIEGERQLGEHAQPYLIHYQSLKKYLDKKK